MVYIIADSTVTPIRHQDDLGHGQILDSDSLSDFQVHRDSKHQRQRRVHKRSDNSRDKSSGDSKGQRSRDRKHTDYGG